MLRLKSFFRLAIVASLLLASLLFPTLHFHFTGDHDHDSEGVHRHGIAHAHFLVSLAGGDNQPHRIYHDGLESHEQDNEIGLVAVTSHKVKGSDQQFQKQLYFLNDPQRQLVIKTFFRALLSKPDSPPGELESRYLGSPRSPPRFV
jgi:hypothetical protein